MCEDFRETDKEEVVGFKVVAKNNKTGEYHSLISGEKYPEKDEDMPVWISQKFQISEFFDNWILPRTEKKLKELMEEDGNVARTTCDPYKWFRPTMVGRTAVFQGRLYANDYCRIWGRVRQGYTCVVVKAKISKDLMRAQFDSYKRVVFCGKRIEILEEV